MVRAISRYSISLSAALEGGGALLRGIADYTSPFSIEASRAYRVLSL